MMDLKLMDLLARGADDVLEDGKVIKKGLGPMDESGFSLWMEKYKDDEHVKKIFK